MKKYIVIVVIAILFFDIAVYVINNNYGNMKADSVGYINDNVNSIRYENGKLRIDVSNNIKEYCLKTTKSKPENNNICFNKINNIAYVSIYEYKKYYLWLLDKNDIVSDYIEINTKDIKK